MTDELKDIFEELVSVYHNLKAEIIVTEVNKNLTNNVDFLINNKSSFSRSYRRDIINIDKREDNNQFVLNLSRNGLYDSLPEALFHGEKEISAKNTFSSKRKKYKEEEKNARSFFSPIENEFFNQRLKIETNERKLLSNFYNLEDDFLIDFWKINKEIPRDYTLKLIKLLPYSFIISGDLELAKLSLEKILNQKITFNKKYRNTITTEQDNTKELGINLVTQPKNVTVAQPFLEVVIGPIKDDEIETFINNKGVQKFIDSFYNYFIPLELDVVTKYITNNNQGFVLNKKPGSMVGISTRI